MSNKFESVVDAKGDLIVGREDNVAQRVPVGADGTALVADSTMDEGVKWEPIATQAELDALSGTYGTPVPGLSTNTADDNRATIQNVIDAISAAGGGVAILPAGTYAVAAPLIIPTNVSIRGQGYGTTIRAKTTGWSGAHLVRLGSGAGVVFDCRVEHMILDCNNLVGIGVYSNNVDANAGLVGVKVRNYTSRGVRFETTDVSGSAGKIGQFLLHDTECLPNSNAGTIGIEIIDPMTIGSVKNLNVPAMPGTGGDCAVRVSKALASEGCVNLMDVRSENCTDTIRFATGSRGSAVAPEGRNGTNVVKIETSALVSAFGPLRTGTTTRAIHDSVRSIQRTDVASYTNGVHASQAQRSLLRASAFLAETIPREHGAPMSSQSILASGRASFFAVYLFAGEIVTNIAFVAGGTGAAIVNNIWFTLVTSGGTPLATTADDGASGWSANAEKVLSLTSPYTVTADGIYYVGCVVNATTVPTLAGISATGAIIQRTPPLAVNDTTNTGRTNPASAPGTWSLTSTSNLRAWAGVG